jgi:hypothetical protein
VWKNKSIAYLFIQTTEAEKFGVERENTGGIPIHSQQSPSYIVQKKKRKEGKELRFVHEEAKRYSNKQNQKLYSTN